VECAGAISELIRRLLVKDYPKLDFSDVRVILLEMQDHLLDGFPQELQENAKREHEKKHVEVQFRLWVLDYDGKIVILDNNNDIKCRTLIWAEGKRQAT
jgi:NADH dehydrogenase